MRKYTLRSIIMQIYINYDDSDKTQEIYSYQGSQVIIITVFKTGKNSVAIVEDINTGEQFEVFKAQLY